ncbi:lysophospholipid acyltransferase family protein [Cytophagaceae bacterium YF14B1]|uniref:Lysophospholipid acyltransferase family protein n=1 Tax=Xanthocytophaga flava TaxID=3048013 RepID=A0AAE3QQT0_9BACT|nr:lysophospholipid acyltransferase family protein [Xanthocytophaga flavus]MDJ1481495.1 lysophospholipid acyltransferase family protein [Xanthocytophaga flavus]
MMRFIARLYFWLIGWKVKNEVPSTLKKYVMIGLPHTSNWDFPIAMAALLILRLKTNYLAKRELFRFPLGIIMRAFGGIPVDRSKHGGLVDAMIDELNKHDEMILLIPPEGTRKYVKDWKTGFYRVAMGANVPIVLAYLDYGRKTTGLKAVFYPTGDYEKDVEVMKSYYKGMKGKYPEYQNV